MILPAAGSAIVFNVGASTGGTDIVAMILAKFTSLEIGKALLASDFLIRAGRGRAVMGSRPACTVCWGFDESLLVDSVIESLNLRKVVTVVSADPEAVKQFILEALNRSATVYRRQRGLYRQGGAGAHHRFDPPADGGPAQPFAPVDQGVLTIVNSSEIVGKGSGPYKRGASFAKFIYLSKT